MELFENYIKGTLSDSQKSEFEDRLKSDKDFASDFKLYLFTVDGIIREESQDNADFGIAMKHISKDRLLEIIGRKKRRPDIFRNVYLKERFAWLAGVAVLAGVFFVCIFFTLKVGNNNVDDLLVAYNYPSISRGGEEAFDIDQMTKEEVKKILPQLEKEYSSVGEGDDQEVRIAGLTLALAYIKVHDRKKAIDLLHELIEKYPDDIELKAQCQNILDQIE